MILSNLLLQNIPSNENHIVLSCDHLGATLLKREGGEFVTLHRLELTEHQRHDKMLITPMIIGELKYCLYYMRVFRQYLTTEIFTLMVHELELYNCLNSFEEWSPDSLMGPNVTEEENNTVDWYHFAMTMPFKSFYCRLRLDRNNRHYPLSKQG